MKLDRIEVRGFKSIRELDLELRPLNVLIGANGAGKSNFLSVFKMLSEMMHERLQLFVSQAGGANALLHFGEKVTSELEIALSFGLDQYRSILVPTAADALTFAKEECVVLMHPSTEPTAVGMGSGHYESRLLNAPVFPTYHATAGVSSRIRSFKIYHLHDTSDSALVKKSGAINDNLYLRPDGSNLAAYLYRLRHSALPQYEAIRDTVRLAAPFFDDFLLRPLPDNTDRIRLEWREPGSDFPFLAHQLSDGSLRFICLATLLLQPAPPEVILIDEPELGLHPYAINLLASLIRSAATRTHLIVSTQSSSLVNEFEPEDLLIAERHDRATTITRVEPDKLNEWLEEYSLGELWEKNVLGGRPSR